MKDYKITEEEINQTILHSPYSLADSPAEAGLKAKQIKKYFYEFIRFLAGKINIHLNDLGVTLENYDELSQAFELIPELFEKDIELGSQIDKSLTAHNTGALSHPVLLEKIESDIEAHNQGAFAHKDIRTSIKAIIDKLDVAYSLASGKNRVYSCEDVLDVLEAIDRNEIFKGDLLLVADSSMPDFTVFETDLKGMPDSCVELDYVSVSNGETDFVAGKGYYYKGVRMIASVGTLETGLLAKSEELEALEDEFILYKSDSSKRLEGVERSLALKEDAFNKVSSASSQIALDTKTEYSLGLVTELSIALPESPSGLEAIVNFRTGAQAPSFDAPASLVFSGDDCSGGRFYPATHRLYEINVKEVMGILSARVGATDFEVIE